jgi:hypothetical protein
MRVAALEGKILNGVPLTPDEMHVVAEALHSEVLSERVLACEALLRLGGQSQRDAAVGEISAIVRDASCGRAPLTPELIMAFFSIPESTLAGSDFRGCLAAAVSHGDEGVRVNSMVALQPLAKAGHQWAKQLLRAGLLDPSEHVRQNARVGLDLAG